MGTAGRGPGYPHTVVLLRRAGAVIAARGGDAFVGVLIATAVLERVVLGLGLELAALSALWGLPLLGRRRFPLLAPLATLVLIATTLFAVPALGHDTGGEVLLMITAVWMLTAHNPPWQAGWGVPAVAAVLGRSPDLDTVLMFIILLAASGVAGTVHRRDRTQTATLHGHVEELSRTRDAALKAAAADERARIARELHDIVAHSVSVMTVQAGAARMQLARDPGQALASVTAVEDATTAALGELDRLIDLLGHGEQAIRGLDDVERLVAQMRDAGLDVRLSVGGSPRTLGAGVDLALYRILQEALTNARKHAGTVRTDVHVAYAPEAVRVRVANDLPPAAGRPRTWTAHSDQGNGLIGMQERVAMYGGRLEVGSRDGCFRIDALVPTP